jgi:hypothetical protein
MTYTNLQEVIDDIDGFLKARAEKKTPADIERINNERMSYAQKIIDKETLLDFKR